VKKTKVRIKYSSLYGEAVFPAYESGIPGLVVARAVNEVGRVKTHGWWVVHVASGYSVTHTDGVATRADAIRVGKLLGELPIDWTKLKGELFANNGIAQMARRIVLENMA